MARITLSKAEQKSLQQLFAMVAAATNPDGSKWSILTRGLADDDTEFAFAQDFSNVDKTTGQPGTSRGVGVEYFASDDPDALDLVTAGQIAVAGMSLRRHPFVTPVPHLKGGLTPFSRLSTADTNLVSVVGTPAQLYGYYISNANAADRYVKLYDKATAPVIVNDAALIRKRFRIPAGQAANLAFTHGVVFTAGIAMAITAGVADTDATAVAANEIIVNLDYKS